MLNSGALGLSTCRLINLDLVTVPKFYFHFSCVPSSVIDCVIANPSAHVELIINPAL